MPVYTNDDLALGLSQADVEGGGDDMGRIVKHSNREGGDDIPRVVSRHAIHDQDFCAVRRIVLGQDGGHAALDVALLVANGHDDRHERQITHRYTHWFSVLWVPTA